MSTTSSEIPTQPPNKLFESDSEGSEDEQKEDGSVYEPSGSEFEDNDDENDNGDGTDGDGTDGVGTDNEVTDSRDQSDNVPETETEEEEEPEPDITEEEMLTAIRMLRDSLNGLKTDLVEFTGAAVAGMVGDHNSQMDKFISGEDEREDDDEDLSQAVNRMAARNATFGLGMAVSVGGGVGSYSPQVPTSSGILASGGSSNVSAMSTPSYSSQDDQDYPFVLPSQPSSSMSPFKKTPGTPKKGNSTPKKEEVVTPKKELFSPQKEVVTPKKETSTPKKAASTPKKKTPKKSPKNASAAEAEHKLLQEIKVEVKDEPEDSVREIVLNDGTVCNMKMDNVCNCPLDHGTPTRSTRSAKKSR